MNPRHRWTLLGSLLAATLGAALLVTDDEPAVPAVDVAAARKRLPETNSPPPTESIAQIQQVDSESTEPTIDPFRRKTWYIAPPPPPVPKPKAPPLPFQYLGQLHEDGEPRVFVNHQGRHLVIRAGDVISGSYAVESVAAGQVVFVYLPLKERQSLPTGTLQ